MQNTTAEIVPFPTPPTPAISIRIDRQSADAIAVLAEARLITEDVAVATLQDLGCTDEEIDEVRGIFSSRRMWRV